MRDFFYNEEIYEDIKSDEDLVICASLGSGKSESVKKYLSEIKNDKILLVVNDGISQNSYYQDLKEKIIIHNKLQLLEWQELAVRDFDDAFKLLKEEQNILCITKSKFNKLLILKPSSFMSFNKIIIDEANGLNPIMVTDLTTDVDKIIKTLAPVMRIKDNLYYNGVIQILTFLKEIQDKYRSKEIILFYQEEIPTELQALATTLMKNLRRLYDKGNLIGIKDVDLLFGILNSLSNNSLFLGDIFMKGKKQVHILFANTFLHDYLNSTNSSIKILDGTADSISPLYNWLKIKVRNGYKCNEKKYPNLKLHIHPYKNLTPAKGRNSIEYTSKIVKNIINEKREEVLTFTINKMINEDIFKDNFDLLEYAFNGKDVGSNEFRNMTEMNVIYYQTLPQTYRMVYNKLFKNLTFQESCSPKYLKEAETELMGAMLSQLVGRLKIRIDNNADVNVHFYCISNDSLREVCNHFKLTKENIVFYDEIDIGVPLINIKEENIINKLKEYLLTEEPEKVVLFDWIKENFYNNDTNIETINTLIKRIQMNNFNDNYKLIKEIGRGKKTYLKKYILEGFNF